MYIRKTLRVISVDYIANKILFYYKKTMNPNIIISILVIVLLIITFVISITNYIRFGNTKKDDQEKIDNINKELKRFQKLHNDFKTNVNKKYTTHNDKSIDLENKITDIETQKNRLDDKASNILANKSAIEDLQRWSKTINVSKINQNSSNITFLQDWKNNLDLSQMSNNESEINSLKTWKNTLNLSKMYENTSNINIIQGKLDGVNLSKIGENAVDISKLETWSNTMANYDLLQITKNKQDIQNLQQTTIEDLPTTRPVNNRPNRRNDNIDNTQNITTNANDVEITNSQFVNLENDLRQLQDSVNNNKDKITELEEITGINSSVIGENAKLLSDIITLDSTTNTSLENNDINNYNNSVNLDIIDNEDIWFKNKTTSNEKPNSNDVISIGEVTDEKGTYIGYT